ncbi:Rne/Rng family ribonuclease [Romboutsia sp. 1001713B170207_170306_H8]|uniref:Rne/Rng family ribonuclease n=1 Tax=Romboutsia sp. 1001713B170207_170306_H8 TaxID=2787112 RepID=UPI001896F367|nr:Rne/Rng family ribonuclease [Romboutsia sp. 1001713B170207_170306_H8]
MKNIVIESLVLSQKTAILEDDKLVELLIEDNTNEKIVSNIYRGVVKNVKPGIEAGFVDIGLDKLAYLPLGKNKDIKSGQDIMVQVNKEGIGSKGAKLNLEISIAGRYLVYIPSNDRSTMSNKITDEKERFRLKKIINAINKEGLGIIVRTEAQGCTLEELKCDLEYLKAKYEVICKEFKLGMGPKLLYKDLDFASKYVKDNVNEYTNQIVVNNEEKYSELKNILKEINKEYVNKLILEKNKDVFDLYKVQGQIEKSINKKVWLKSGGYLIIDKTEAMTVIDVNTGKYTGSIKLEETVYKTNLEAAKEIARQLKLRDIGGIIIIDFIDMHKKEYKKELLKILSDELKKDKRKSEVLGLTRLGLVEVARRREKSSIDTYFLGDCPTCKEHSYLKSINSIIDDIEKEVMRISEHTSYKSISIELNNEVYKEINQKWKNILNTISKKYDIIIKSTGRDSISYEKINIIFNT